MTAALYLSRRLTDWRDLCLIEAEEGFLRLSCDLERLLAEDLARQSLRKALALKAWTAKVATPLVAARLGVLCDRLERDATEGMAMILDGAPDFVRREAGVRAAGAQGRVLLDALSAGVPIAVAGWLVAALPAASVTTVTAWLGLSTVAVISTPVLVTGLAVVAVAATTGVTRLTGLRQRLDSRQIAEVHASLRQAILDGPESHLALYRRAIHAAFDKVMTDAAADPLHD